jgi:hypothetical protein
VVGAVGGAVEAYWILGFRGWEGRDVRQEATNVSYSPT